MNKSLHGSLKAGPGVLATSAAAQACRRIVVTSRLDPLP